MPIHDWTRVDAGIFHDFHQSWVPEIARIVMLPLEATYVAAFADVPARWRRVMEAPLL
jgi:hypothetical protein